MISVEEATARILAAARPAATETVHIAQALDRVLAADVTARISHPASDMSSMDGYAVRFTDIETVPARLAVVGHVPAGSAFDGVVGAGQAVRLFTGAPLPAGTDTVVLQEDCDAGDGMVTVREGGPKGRWIRRAGQDFAAGDPGPRAGRQLTARDIALAAAMNVSWLTVRRAPRVALLATGDEIVMPGDTPLANQVVSCNTLGLAQFVRRWGGVPVDLGVARDNADSLADALRQARGADLLLTTGGASVGDYDLVGAALKSQGLELDFWRIALRPGKPLMFGRLGEMPVLGLPGNPVSAFVCALLFARPLLRALQGLPADDATVPARLAVPLAGNDNRQDYLRATLERRGDGLLWATPFGVQDSAMISRFAAADALLVRPPHAAAAAPGDLVDVIPLADL